MSRSGTGPNGRSRWASVENWVKIVGAVCAVLTLALGAYKVSIGPDSLESKLRQTTSQGKVQLCWEGVGVVSALATFIADAKAAPQVKQDFMIFYNGKIKLLEQPVVDALFERVYQRYQDEVHGRGDFAADRKEGHGAAYQALSADLKSYTGELATQCNRLPTKQNEG